MWGVLIDWNCMVTYHALAYCCLVNQETHEPYFPLTRFEFDTVSFFGEIDFGELVEITEFHYRAKMLRDSNREPDIKKIIKAKDYYVDVLMERIDQKG